MQDAPQKRSPDPMYIGMSVHVLDHEIVAIHCPSDECVLSITSQFGRMKVPVDVDGPTITVNNRHWSDILRSLAKIENLEFWGNPNRNSPPLQ